MSDGPAPTECSTPQNYPAIGKLYDNRVQSGQLGRQHAESQLAESRSAILQVLGDELYKPQGKSNIRMVELGCGVGYNTRDLLATDPYFQDPSRHVSLIGIDLSAESLKEYDVEVAKIRRGVEVKTILDTIGNGVNQVNGPIDNVMSTGVFQIPPDELIVALEMSLPLLENGGAFIYQFIPPQKGEATMGDEPIQTKGLGDYFSYRYTKPYFERIVGEIAQLKGLSTSVKVIDFPETIMPHPLNPQSLIPNKTSMLVIHRI